MFSHPLHFLKQMLAETRCRRRKIQARSPRVLGDSKLRAQGRGMALALKRKFLNVDRNHHLTSAMRSPVLR